MPSKSWFGLDDRESVRYSPPRYSGISAALLVTGLAQPSTTHFVNRVACASFDFDFDLSFLLLAAMGRLDAQRPQ